MRVSSFVTFSWGGWQSNLVMRGLAISLECQAGIQVLRWVSDRELGTELTVRQEAGYWVDCQAGRWVLSWLSDRKISLLADDATFILEDTNSLKNVLNILNIFHLSSGLKINIDKTKALYIGNLKGCGYYPHGLSWIKDNLKTLGIVFTSTIEGSYKHNFEGRINNLRTTLNIWKQRYLTIKGKIKILNNLALAPLIYVSSVIDTPEKAIKEVDTIIPILYGRGRLQKY